MEIKCLFGQRKCSYEGEYGPELLVAWDEFSFEENEQGFTDECEKQRQQLADEFTTFALVNVSVSQDMIVRYLNETPTIKGEVSM